MLLQIVTNEAVEHSRHLVCFGDKVVRRAGAT